jgi:predicted  nucleic acid-binding Zn-ribbon protein
MRLSIAIFLLGLCGSIYANQVVFTELAQINENPFGATILAAVSANLRVKTPITEIQDLLQQILNDLLKDSGALDTYYTQTKQNLETQISSSDSTITGYANLITSLTNAIESDTQTRSTRQSTLENVERFLQTTQESLDSLIAEYNSKIPNFEADILDLKAAIKACEDALAKMATYKSATAVSLLQVATSASKELQHFSEKMSDMKSKLTKHGSMYGPLIHELVALTQNPESDKATKIVDLLNQLLALLRKALEDLENQKATYEVTYQTEKTRLEDDLISYNTQKTSLTEEITGLDKRIDQATNDRISTAELKQSAEKILADQRVALENLEAYYSTERPKYDKLIEIMNKLIAHFQVNVADVDEWTRTQINNGF